MSDSVEANKNISIKNIPINKKGVIFICNHIGFFEVPILAKHIDFKTVTLSNMVDDDLSVLSNVKDHVNEIFDFVTYNRELGEQNKEIKEKIYDVINNEDNILIFPEGTISENTLSGMKPFKRGLFHLTYDNNIEIIPIVISSKSETIGYTRKKRNSLDILNCISDTSDLQVEFLNNVKSNSFLDFESYFNFIRCAMLEKLKEMNK